MDIAEIIIGFFLLIVGCIGPILFPWIIVHLLQYAGNGHMKNRPLALYLLAFLLWMTIASFFYPLWRRIFELPWLGWNDCVVSVAMILTVYYFVDARLVSQRDYQYRCERAHLWMQDAILGLLSYGLVIAILLEVHESMRWQSGNRIWVFVYGMITIGMGGCVAVDFARRVPEGAQSTSRAVLVLAVLSLFVVAFPLALPAYFTWLFAVDKNAPEEPQATNREYS